MPSHSPVSGAASCADQVICVPHREHNIFRSSCGFQRFSPLRRGWRYNRWGSSHRTEGRVSILLGHTSLKVTEKPYPPWVKTRQEQVETELRKTGAAVRSRICRRKGYTKGARQGGSGYLIDSNSLYSVVVRVGFGVSKSGNLLIFLTRLFHRSNPRHGALQPITPEDPSLHGGDCLLVRRASCPLRLLFKQSLFHLLHDSIGNFTLAAASESTPPERPVASFTCPDHLFVFHAD